jgi:hypothetical protein
MTSSPHLNPFRLGIVQRILNLMYHITRGTPATAYGITERRIVHNIMDLMINGIDAGKLT